MVEVSLLELVGIPGTRPVWPAEFAAMVAKCEENPDDRIPFGVVADWCDEKGETELGRAWRWLSKRPWDEEKKVGVNVVKKLGSWEHVEWEFRNLPGSVSIFTDYRDVSTLAGRVAGLARRLAEIDKETQV